jgi:hypothetical protein
VACVVDPVSLLTCRDDRPRVTVVVRCLPLARGPDVAQLPQPLALGVSPVLSGRGRLGCSGPPRPGTDRPAGHGKADQGLGQATSCSQRKPEQVSDEAAV